jgi:uncharacterized protein YjbJ (UPF0337 family)
MAVDWNTTNTQNRFQGDARIFWGKLTESDNRDIAGNRDRLIAKLQERYGWSREQAVREVMLHFGK